MNRPKVLRHRLALKIVAWSFIPTIVILAGVALYTYGAYQQVTEDLVIERDHQVTRLWASQLSNELNNYTGLLTEIARIGDLRQSNPVFQVAALKALSNRLVVFDGGVVVLNSHGQMTAADPERPDVMGQDWSDRDYFSEILRTHQPAYSNILYDGLLGVEVIAAAAPIYGNSGEIHGVLVGMFRTKATAVSALYGGVVKQRIGGSGRFYLVDGSGHVIYHPEVQRVGDDFSDQPVVQRLLSGEAGALRTTDVENHDIVAGYAPIPGTSWGLVTEERWSALISGIQGYREFLSALIILGIIIPVIFVFVGVRRITRPIDDLIRGAQQVAQGNFEQAITANTGDEIEELADQFTQMAHQLHESYTQLEQRVADRTRELEALYQADEELYRHLDLSQVLQALVDVSVDILKADKSSILSWDAQHTHLVVRASKGYSAEIVPQMTFAPGEGLVGQVAITGNPVLVEDSEKSSDLAVRITAPEGIRSFMHLPIKVDEHIFGVYNVSFMEPRAFTESQQRLFMALAHRVSLAIENAQLYEQAQYVAAVEERQRLARELHDAVTQSLFSASLIAEVLNRLWEKNPEEGKRRLEELRQLTRGALAEMRTLLLELRPSALMEAETQELFRQLCDAFAGRALVSVKCTMDGECDLPSEIKIAFYRIAQEAMNNIAKHAQAKNVEVQLSCRDGRAVLEIQDDGRGFDDKTVPPDHLGLGIMRERADKIGAVLELTSGANQGTRVLVTWQHTPALE